MYVMAIANHSPMQWSLVQIGGGAVGEVEREDSRADQNHSDDDDGGEDNKMMMKIEKTTTMVMMVMMKKNCWNAMVIQIGYIRKLLSALACGARLTLTLPCDSGACCPS